MQNLDQSLKLSTAAEVPPLHPVRGQMWQRLGQGTRFVLGLAAVGCALLPLYAFYFHPWFKWEWLSLDQWLAAHNCVIQAWCIPQLSQQPTLIAAFVAILLFALAYWRPGPLLPFMANEPPLSSPSHPWRSWLAVSLFGALAVVAVGLQAYDLIIAGERAVTPWHWGLGLFAALATALLWDTEDLTTLRRTLANGSIALTLGMIIIATAAVVAGRGPLAWAILVVLLVLFALSSYWSMRIRTFLRPIDHIAMLGLSLLALALALRHLWSWHYAFIGDEWGFLEIATVLLHRPELYQTFTTHDSNGYHTVFSSYLQAWTMLATQENLYGWRLSSLLPMIFSVPAVYAFAYWWAGRGVAWLSASVLAASHMLLSFSMVAYNNTQALLPLALGLGCFAFALRSNSRLRFLLVGMVVGLGFLVYGLGRLAAIPIGLLLLLHIWPDREQYVTTSDTPATADARESTATATPRPTPAWQWLALSRMFGAGIAVLFGAMAMAAPMLFNLQNWQDMMMATPAESEVVGRIDPIVQMWRNVILGAHSFLTNQRTTHFVVGPYVDPITGVLVLVGIGALLGNFWQRTRWASVFLSCWLLILVTSAIQQYDHVSHTRMFLLIVCYALFAGLGGTLLLRTVLATLHLKREGYLLAGIVPVIVGIVWLNQWHIVHVAQPNSQELPIALVLQQLQESAATDGGGMPVVIVANDSPQRMNLIVHAYAIPRERALFLETDELLTSPEICAAASEPTMALIEAKNPQLAQIEQYFSDCWPKSELTPLKNQANEVVFYRFLTPGGVAELAKAPKQRLSHHFAPDTLYLRNPSSLAISSNDQLFVLSHATGKVRQVTAAGEVVASFTVTPTTPTALALSPDGDIVVASQDPEAPIAWYSAAGKLLRHLSAAEVRVNPTGLAITSSGELYVSDGGNGRILHLIPPQGGLEESETILATLTANGELRNPGALALARDETLWVLDRATRSLLHVAPDDELLDTIALPVTQELEHAQLLVTQKGELLLSAPADARILRLNPAGEVIERWFGFSSPTALALASDGRLFVADPTVDQIGILPPLRASIPAVALPEILTPEGQPISPLSPLLTPAETITDESQAATFRRIGAGALKQPLGVAVNANGQLYVADPDRSELAIFAPDGALLHQITEGSGPLDRPNDVTIDQAGNVLLLDSGRGEIIVFNSEGVYLRTLVADIDLLGDARGLGAGSDGSVWVASTRRGHIIQIGSDGQVILEYPSTPADDGQPVDVAVDGEGRIYLVEASTLQLVQLSRLGIRRNSWSLQGFNTGNAPHLAIDSNDALYITAPEQGIVTKFDEQGRVLASWQLPRPADVAVKPIGIDVDAQGNIYVASVEQGIVIAIAPQ